MPRYKLIIEYDGTGLVGWQRQVEGLSVQGLLEDTLQKFTPVKTTVWGAGRTDAGVHALAQVAHINLAREWVPFRLREAINYHLRPHNIAIIHCEEVDQDFHARFSAQYRCYSYRIINRYAPLTLEKNRAWRIMVPLNIETMQQAAKILIGTHDFTSFRAQECQAHSPVKTLDQLDICYREQRIEAFVKAKSFLHHQVRNMMGALVWVGRGHWTVEQFEQAFLQRDRRHAAPTAPACGLYFVEVGYDCKV